MTEDTYLEGSLELFYALMERLRTANSGGRSLSSCKKKTGWPDRGVYFFFDSGEVLDDGRLRVVRVGTHAITENSSTTLWNRLSQHRGATSRITGASNGNHRGSVFRRHVGDALIAYDRKYESISATWGVGSTATPEIRDLEEPLENAVSTYIGNLSVLWLDVSDPPSPVSDRAVI